MRKTVSLLLLAVCFCVLPACGGNAGSGGQAASNLQGPPADILSRVLEEAGKALPTDRPMPMSFDVEVTGETSQNALGLSASDFDKYATAASSSMAAIMTFAHEICLVEAKDAASAAEIKKLIAGEGGYDSRKWICVFPEESCVVVSGNYVLLAVSTAEIVEAVLAAFAQAAGATGEAEVFFSMEELGEAGGIAPGGGGMPLNLG